MLSRRKTITRRPLTRMIELPVQDPCTFCEGIAGREKRWGIVEEDELTLTVINPWQFEVGQCCVITRRHAPTLLDLSPEELAAILHSARRIAEAMLATFQPLGILTFQNNGVYSGQEVPHYHFHVVPRQPGSEWGIGPPQIATFESAGRARGTVHDPSGDEARRQRVQVPIEDLKETVDRLQASLPGRH